MSGRPKHALYFAISTDPQLVDKVHDVVGFYLDPPAGALVLSVDEKPGIQATERVAPVAPMTPGTPERRSYDCRRHGTIDLFAALDTATGTVLSTLAPKHRAVEFRDFLDLIDQQTDPALTVHLICDNLATHEAPVIHRWLLAHPRFHLHFTPTYSSWLNEVERWFAELQRRQLERGSARSSSSARRWNGGSPCGTPTRTRSSGPPPPTRSSAGSPATAKESQDRLTSATWWPACCSRWPRPVNGATSPREPAVTIRTRIVSPVVRCASRPLPCPSIEVDRSDLERCYDCAGHRSRWVCRRTSAAFHRDSGERGPVQPRGEERQEVRGGVPAGQLDELRGGHRRVPVPRHPVP
jgi:DDE superfamily endonuclease